MEGSVVTSMGTMQGAVIFATLGFCIIFLVALIKIANVDVMTFCFKTIRKIVHISGSFIDGAEKRYYREITIGKINEKTRKVRVYRFLNDLIIDLGLKKKGATPYEFLAFTIVGSIILSIALCQLLLGSLLMGVLMSGVVFAAVLCALYTKANLTHDTRIEAVIEAENIICNNIKEGVIVSIKNSIDLIPEEVRGEFIDLLDNINHKNYHPRTALLELNNNLGSISDDFIKKCIEFEMNEEHGIVGMFRDVVEINNMKTALRTDLKRVFEAITAEFIIGAVMILVFLGGVIAIYPVVRTFYFNTVIGNFVIGIDIILMVSQFVWITYLKSREL